MYMFIKYNLVQCIDWEHLVWLQVRFSEVVIAIRLTLPSPSELAVICDVNQHFVLITSNVLKIIAQLSIIYSITT